LSTLVPNATGNNCFQMTFPFIIGGTTGDTIITAADITSNSKMFYIGGSSNDSSIIDSVDGTMKPFVGIITYSGIIDLLAQVHSTTT
jgi:hypothetical protein